MITTINHIISNAVDMCGGAQVENAIAWNTASLHCANVIDDMELELVSSAKGQTRKRVPYTLNANGGTISFMPNYIRFRPDYVVGAGVRRQWRSLPIVSDIEDLTEAENTRREAIFIYPAPNTQNTQFKYLLSWVCAQPLVCELWGSIFEDDAATLSDATSFPAQFAQLAAVRTAMFLLDDLLLNEDAAKYKDFVLSRQGKLAVRARLLTHRWEVYRTNADEDLSDNVTRNFDPLEADNFGSNLGRW